MMNWSFNPSEYSARTFVPIPEGDHKVMIHHVEEKTFSSGNEGFKITMKVDGYNSKLWYYLVVDPKDSAKTNQRFGEFFDCFAIRDYDLSHYNEWCGKDGAVRVKHELYDGNRIAKVAFCMSRKHQGKFLRQNANPPIEQTRVATVDPRCEFNGFQF